MRRTGHRRELAGGGWDGIEGEGEGRAGTKGRKAGGSGFGETRVDGEVRTVVDKGGCWEGN